MSRTSKMLAAATLAALFLQLVPFLTHADPVIIRFITVYDTGQRKDGNTTFGVVPNGVPGPVRLGLVHVEWWNNLPDCGWCNLLANGAIVAANVPPDDCDANACYFSAEVWLEVESWYTFEAICCYLGPDDQYDFYLPY